MNVWSQKKPLVLSETQLGHPENEFFLPDDVLDPSVPKLSHCVTMDCRLVLLTQPGRGDCSSKQPVVSNKSAIPFWICLLPEHDISALCMHCMNA